MHTDVIHFPRPALARVLVDKMCGRGLFGDGHNGVFLAAPRRTGKSAFIKSDLRPALEAEGILFIYADLWEDTQKEPASVIAQALSRAIEDNLGIVAKAAKATGLKSVSIGGALHFDTSRIGTKEGMSLTEALRQLNRMTGMPIALIIDEAQQALTTEEGEKAMRALKSARDQLNVGSDIRLMLMMTGSDRDKLTRLVIDYSAPFYGSSVQTMPALGEDFIAFVAQLMEDRYPIVRPVNRTVLMEAFELFRRRPQLFGTSLFEQTDPLESDAVGFERRVLTDAREQMRRDEMKMVSIYLGLPPLQRAVFTRLLETGSKFKPYDRDACVAYGDALGKKVAPAQVQKALDQLRAYDPAIIWKSARKEYAVDDSAMYCWYQQRVDAGCWPPT